MSARLATLLGLVGATALSIWFGKRRQRQPVETEANTSSQAVYADDDNVADIIRRAQPALQRASRLTAAWNN